MDAPLVSFELKEKYLLVVGHGKRDNLLSMVEASEQIYQKIIETNCHHLLVDYRNLEINVHLNEAFNIVKRYETTQPELKKIIIAAVFTKKGLDFGMYWKEIGMKKGFHISIFEDIDIAEKWLETEFEINGLDT
ncbi:MAG: hypothetical protein WDN75_09950 [Bacteroidota bacterium]